MKKIKKFFWKLGNKKKRLLLKIAARIIVSQKKPGMDYFGWKTCRWLMDVNGVFLVCYLCKDFKRTYDVPFGDNSVQINGKGGLRCNGNQESSESSRHPVPCIAEDIQKARHPSQGENRDSHDRTVQDQNCCSSRSQTERCPSQC